MPISLFAPQAIADLEQRLSHLQADTRPQWGKMNATEMLNHCAAQMEIALGEKPMKTNFLMRLVAKFVKSSILSGRTMPKNSRTAQELLPVNVGSFDDERDKLVALMRRMKERESVLQDKKHPFFGKMSADEYGKITWSHLDYHFGQFGL